MPYLSKAKLFRCSDRSASMKQITYIGLALLVDVQGFAIWPFKTTVCVRVGVKRGTRGQKPAVVHLHMEGGFHGLEECAQGLKLFNLLLNNQDTLTNCMLTKLAGDPCAGGTASYWVPGGNSKCSQQG